MGKFYLTTPIYYPSDKLHIGHAYTTVIADALARYHRQIGDDAYFLTGTDEHGQKIQRRAEAAGKSPQEFVDEIVKGIKSLWQLLKISNDDFIRTTEERHVKRVQEIFCRLHEQGDIYKSEYEGWYCTPCETFWLERQLVEGRCPDCGREVEIVHEESYFFRLSKYADRLLEHIETHPEFIQPVSRRNEMINNFLRPGLEDLCVSRTTFSWGITVPFDSKHVVYVWLDALTNYITALGYPDDPELFQRYWPADLHLVGKEIVRFHTIIWPIILMALELPLPRRIFGHGWLVLEGGKMSKSKGNVIDPMVLVAKYGLDAVRYYLLREMPFGADGVYSEDALILRINNDLANDLGNLLHRTVAMINKFSGGTVPEPNDYEDLDREVINQAESALQERKECIERLEISSALAAIFRLVEKTNKYIDTAAPWALNKEGRRERLATVLYTMAESLRVTALLLTPFLVETPEKIWIQLGLGDNPATLNPETEAVWGRFPAGTQVRKGEPLFPRIDVEKETRGPEKKPASAGKKEKTSTAATPPTAAEPQTEPSKDPAATLEREGTISIEEFARLDLRVAKVLDAQRVPDTDKLLQLSIRLGGEERRLVAGIGKHYEPSSLIGREIVVVANLKPAKIRGLLSQGMLLAASDGEELALVVPEKSIGEGAQVR